MNKRSRAKAKQFKAGSIVLAGLAVFAVCAGEVASGREQVLRSRTRSRELDKASLGSFFDGLIDDVRIYSRALSAAEIRAMYYAVDYPDGERRPLRGRQRR